MKPKLKLIATAALALVALNASAAVVYGSVGNIVHLYSYATTSTGSTSNGDVVVVAVSTLTGCADGFWLRASDPGSKNVFAQLLSARLTQTPIKVWVYTDQLWSQSAGQFCRIESIDLDM